MTNATKTDTKIVTVKGILYELIKVNGVWRYLKERCHCPCKERVLYKKSNKSHGVPKFLIGHDKIGKHITEEHRENLIKLHAGKKSSRWDNQPHITSLDIKSKISESMRERYILGYQGKDEYDLKAYLISCVKQSEKQGFGAVFLNTPKKGYMMHHVDETYVIFMPVLLHRINGHRLVNKKKMDKVNRIALRYIQTKDRKRISKMLNLD